MNRVVRIALIHEWSSRPRDLMVGPSKHIIEITREVAGQPFTRAHVLNSEKFMVLASVMGRLTRYNRAEREDHYSQVVFTL